MNNDEKILVPYISNRDGDASYLVDVSNDSFIHFAEKERIQEIIKSGKLLMNPPHIKYCIDAVTAVSAKWGWYAPKVQANHIIKRAKGIKNVGAICFRTDTIPDYGRVDEVVWHEDVNLIEPKEEEFNIAVMLLASTPERTNENNMIIYSENKLKEISSKYVSFFHGLKLLGGIK